MTPTNPTLACQLAEAQQAYHNLQTGVMPRVVVDQNGERVEFTAANSQKLYAYVQSLQAQCGTPATVLAALRPAQFYF